jgi:hypothetical protein
MDAERKGNARRIAIGLLPIFALQSLALPMLVHRELKYPRSSSRAYGEFIRTHPQYSNAVLMSEPDYHMESMPYYVPNRIFMPRQHEFTNRVHFDSGERRTNILSLGDLMSIADSVACATKSPVLLSIGYPDFQYVPTGAAYPLYRGLSFTWSAPEWVRLGAPRPLVAFPQSTTDEVYRIYERRCS